MSSAHSSPTPADPIMPPKTRQLRVPPLRSLQHSPSLPNIWFPPHRGPLPDQLKNGIARESLHQPTTPPAMSRTSPLPISPQKSDHSPSADTPKAGALKLPPRNVSPSPVRSHDEKKPLRLQATAKHFGRSLIERQQSHKLLTPPLTPSSSIRTTASMDSSLTDVSVESSEGVQAARPWDDALSNATRFLLVGNVARGILNESLTFHIMTALSAANLRDFMGSVPSSTPIATKNTRPSIASATSSSDSPIKGIFVRYVESQGVIVVAFHDIRYAVAAKRFMSVRRTDILDICLDGATSQWFLCSYLSDSQLYQMIGDNTYIQAASFYISVEDMHEPVVAPHEFDNGQLVNKLISFGAIHSWEVVDSLNDDDQRSMYYYVEFCDTRAAALAYASLYGQVLLGKRLITHGKDDFRRSDSSEMYRGSSLPESTSDTPSFEPPHTGHSSMPTSVASQISHAGEKSQIRDRFVYPDAIDTSRRLNQEDNTGAWPTTDNTSPMFFGSREHVLSAHAPSQDSVSDHEHTDVSTDEASLSTHSDSDGPPYQQFPPNAYFRGAYYPSQGDYAMIGYSPTPPSIPFTASPSLLYPGSPPPPGLPFPYDESQLMAGMSGLALGNHPFDPSVPFTNCLFPHPGAYAQMPPELWSPHQTPIDGPYFSPPDASSDAPPPGAFLVPSPDHTSRRSSALALTDGRFRFQGSLKKRAANNSGNGTTADQAQKNQLDLANIENGIDTRTTIMIKNIPNKMSDRDLITYISRVCPRRIDFLYLRMDFENGCNVGYAFVNFIEVRDLLLFAKKRLGQKWNMFSSDKVLQMSYANYQGKEALVEKFKNSCIMDEQEAWQPKIFYSEAGPQQGLPEPFPAPTHMRRKERSLHNRGNLFPPGSSLNAAGPSRRGADSEDCHPQPHGERRSRFRISAEGFGRQFLSSGGKSSRVF